MNYSLTFLFWAEWLLVLYFCSHHHAQYIQTSAWIFCAFRDAVLHTLVLKVYRCSNERLFPYRLKHSVYSPLISDINEVFSFRELILTGYFLFVGPFSVSFRGGTEMDNPRKWENDSVICLLFHVIQTLRTWMFINLGFFTPCEWIHWIVSESGEAMEAIDVGMGWRKKNIGNTHS